MGQGVDTSSKESTAQKVHLRNDLVHLLPDKFHGAGLAMGPEESLDAAVHGLHFLMQGKAPVYQSSRCSIVSMPLTEGEKKGRS